MNVPERLVLIGWGAIGRTVGRLLADVRVDLVGVAVRSARDEPGFPASARLITDPDELADLDPDVVAEAAGRDSVATWGRTALASGADLIVSSVSALADTGLLTSLRALADRHGAQLIVQPGALAGVEALRAARLLGVDRVEHRIVKPPRAWVGTPAEDLCDLEALVAPEPFHVASAAETARAFPKNANVAMTTALAGVGPGATTITLVADPTATTNRHEIHAEGAFGRLDVTIANEPLPDNPKTSAMAALSLVRAIENRSTSFVI